MVEVEAITYDYADKRALDSVNFTLAPNSITALVGPNGSGKTTLLRLLAALERPQQGNITVNGANTATHPREVHRQVGYLQDLFGLYEHLTVLQSMQFIAYSRLAPNADHEAAMALAADRTGIRDLLPKKVSTLSRGMKQRLGIAQAILHNPQLLLLDEPASGLDPEARSTLSTMLVNLSRSGITIMVSSHILAELEDYSTHMLVLDDGRILEHRPLGKVDHGSGMLVLSLTVPATYINQLQAIPGVVMATAEQGRVHVTIDTNTLPKHDLLRKALMAGIPVEEFTEARIDLNEEYLRTVQNHRNNTAQ